MLTSKTGTNFFSTGRRAISDSAELKILFEGEADVLGILGEGGMGVVYKAYQHAFQRTVAIKAMHGQMYADRESVQRFLNEARSLGNLKHPNIVRTFSLGATSDNKPYIIMEYVEGETLSTIFEREAPLGVEQVVTLFSQVLAGLQHAHSEGFVHRDLKPSNIMVTADGAVKIMDFGIAKHSSVSQSLTATGDVIGSPAYMSPEQARSAKGLDARSDIYSVACMMYEALEGHTPFEADSPMELLMKVLNDPAPKVTKGNLKLATIIERGLAKQPSDRFAGAAEMNEELIAAKTDTRSVTTETQRPSKRQKLFRAPAILPFVAIAAVLICACFFWTKGEERQRDTEKKAAQLNATREMNVEDVLKEANTKGGKLWNPYLTKSEREAALADALSSVNHAADIVKTQHLPRMKTFEVEVHRAQIYQANGQTAEAGKIFDQAFANADLEDPLMTMDVLIHAQIKAGCELSLKQYGKAKRDYELAERKLDEYLQGLPDEKLQGAQLYGNWINYYSTIGEMKNCLKYAKKQYDLTRQYGGDSVEAREQKSGAKLWYGYYLCKNDSSNEGLPLVEDATREIQSFCVNYPKTFPMTDFESAVTDLQAAYQHCKMKAKAAALQPYRDRAIELSKNNQPLTPQEAATWRI